jgi:hypothetical protein
VGGAGAVIFPQFVAGGGWSSDIVLMNSSATTLAVRIDLFRADGTPLTTRFNGTSGSSLPKVSVPAEGAMRETNDDNGALQVGYAVVTPVSTAVNPLGSGGVTPPPAPNTPPPTVTPPSQIRIAAVLTLPASFVSSQTVYADADRIYLSSYQGTLFVVQRDRKSNFPVIQTISFGAPLTSIRGDVHNVYIASANGYLYLYKKTTPLQLVQAIPLSNYGLSSVQVVGTEVFVAKGQSAMAATETRLYLSEVNPGDFAINVNTLDAYGGETFVRGMTLSFDSRTGQETGAIPDPSQGGVAISAWGPSVFLTVPGCCGSGVQIYDAASLSPVQYLNRPTNVVAGTDHGGHSLLIGGSESGNVDLYTLGPSGYHLSNSLNLPALTGFTAPEDIEIRGLWMDGLDNLVFAASSGGNDQSRTRGDLPTFFILELH